MRVSLRVGMTAWMLAAIRQHVAAFLNRPLDRLHLIAPPLLEPHAVGAHLVGHGVGLDRGFDFGVELIGPRQWRCSSAGLGLQASAAAGASSH